VPPTAPPAAPRWSAFELLPALLSLVLGSVLLLPGRALWFDELFTAEVARLPLADIVSAVGNGEGITSYLAGVPPSYNAPYYVVLSLLTALPGVGGDTSLRLISLLATAGGLALITRAVTRLAGRATGVLAGLVLAASPLVVEQSVEARSYGLAVLATGAAALGLVRWLQEAPRGLMLFGLAGTAMGLMHWYAVTTLAAFVVAALVLRRRGALPVLGVGAVAVIPTLAMVVVNLTNGTGARNAEHLKTTDGRLSLLALDTWSAGRTSLLVVLVALMVVGAVRASGARVLAAAWVVVPLSLLTVGELVRPLYLPRYLLTGLLGIGVLAAVGAWALPRLARGPAAALLLVLTLVATTPLLERGPRERGDELVALIAELQRPGEPVVAADQRSAMAVDHYVRLLHPELRADLVLPPDDAPPDADRVWMVRRIIDGLPEPTDDDEILRAAGLTQAGQWELPASKTDLVLQLWTR
jgi:4-amino-4-deoxy-L-arabinose transferase-like glycosyltransferase